MESKVKFKDWFSNKLIVSRFPLPSEIEKSDCDIFINVSDEYISSCHITAVKSNKMYFWFPMNECTKEIGLNSIYGALQIMYNAELDNKKVYLHCHAGVNRSPTVMECYHFMRTGHFLELKNSRLKNNVEFGHLPCINSLKEFLKQCQDSFNKSKTMRGGQLDSCKLKSKCD